MPNKTDRNDARGVVHIMRTGWYNPDGRLELDIRTRVAALA